METNGRDALVIAGFHLGHGVVPTSAEHRTRVARVVRVTRVARHELLGVLVEALVGFTRNQLGKLLGFLIQIDNDHLLFLFVGLRRLGVQAWLVSGCRRIGSG